MISKSSKQILSSLEKLMSAEGNYKEYRETIKLVNPPTIPYMYILFFFFK